jgi:hypothetical protein
MSERVASEIGKLLRYVCAGVAFYYWQHSVWGAIFAVFTLVTLEMERS